MSFCMFNTEAGKSWQFFSPALATAELNKIFRKCQNRASSMCYFRCLQIHVNTLRRKICWLFCASTFPQKDVFNNEAVVGEENPFSLWLVFCDQKTSKLSSLDHVAPITYPAIFRRFAPVSDMMHLPSPDWLCYWLAICFAVQQLWKYVCVCKIKYCILKHSDDLKGQPRNVKLEIWSQRPMYFAAAIAIHHSEGGVACQWVAGWHFPWGGGAS